MVKNVIKVFARLKKETSIKQDKPDNYIISRSATGYEDLIIPCRSSSDSSRCSYHQFRYHKVFDQNSSQDEVFNVVAKPVVSSVMHGFNGTIFAYGQTGTGKTYSITGCPKNYNYRGIIPRCVEYVFEYLNKNPDLYSVHLSYLEIYNEVGYDLLNPKQIACRLEEFPRVIMLEDSKGEAHLRNLTIHPVYTEKEAMRFLFLGDTNRTIAETPTNEYSSRSHCIFTIYLSSSSNGNGKQIKSKLHIVDLAGSERVHKSNISGTILNEAKNINLSLHYLENVILALSSRKGHIPFRNSMLTYLLRDSLCGNSLTTMLATLDVSGKNIDETVSTCRFSRRVSMISTEPTINEEQFSSQQEISILQNQISELKMKLMKYENNSLTKPYVDDVVIEEIETVTPNKEEYYKQVVDDFMAFNTNVTNLTSIDAKLCMKIMRDNYFKKKQSQETMRAQIRMLENKLEQKDEEIATLKKALELKINFINTTKDAVSTEINSIRNTPSNPASSSMRHNTARITKSPRRKYESDIEEYNDKLDKKYEEAKAAAETIERCKQNIINVRTRLEAYCTDQVRNQFNAELCQQQNYYRESILTLREIEKETNHLKLGLLQVEVKMKRGNLEPRSTHAADIYINSSLNDKLLHSSRIKEYQKTCNYQISSPRPTFQLSSPTVGSTTSDTRNNVDVDPFVIKNFNLPEREADERCTTPYQIQSRNIDAFADVQKDARDSNSYFQMLVKRDDGSVEDKFPEYSKQSVLDDSIVDQTAQVAEVTSLFKDEMLDLQFAHDSSPDHLIHFLRNVENISSNYETLTNETLDSRSDRNSMHPMIDVNPRGMDFTKCDLEENSNSFYKPTPNTNLKLYKENDSEEFKEFIKSIPLTGDPEVDEEIFIFYRSKFRNKV